MAVEILERRPIEAVSADPQQGLTALQAQVRQEAGWDNVPPISAGKTEKEIVLSHCFTFFNMVFLVLAVFLAITGSSVKNMTFLVIVFINTIIGIFQEIRAKRAVEKLTLVAEGKVRTLRSGTMALLSSRELVRDDIIELRAGDQVCADGILRLGQLLVNESLITGEDAPVTKNPGDQLRSGSFLIAGTGRIQLTGVGGDAFANKLALEAKNNPEATKSGMMRSLDKLIQVVGFLLIPVGLALFYQQFKTLELSLQASAEATAAALVGMIPEGLYLLTSVAMAASALKLSRQKVLVQDMNCIETLARVDVLCVDKTGTITEPKMEVANVVPLTREPPELLEELLRAYYAGSEPENDTAQAMQEMFAGKSRWRCTRQVPFTSQNKWSAKEFAGQGCFIVGAPKTIMGSRFEEISQETAEWAALGYRVLLVAEYGSFPENNYLEERRLRPLALITLTNRIRPEAPDTFAYFKSQGVTIKVISGDDPATVSDVARRANIENAERYIDCSTLETEEAVRRAATEYTVFGRVTPEQKKLLVMALKDRGHTVAMTGDGVNDVLAMKEAHCGIAMASGSQAASQVAKLVLLENDFAVMPSIVGEGRRVINNIQRAAALFLVKNIFSFFLSCISIFTSLPYPLMPLHLTVISAFTIGVPSFFLAMEPNYQRVSGRFLAGALRRAFPGGLTNCFVVLAALIYMQVFGLNMEEISTICTAILAVVGMLVLFQVCKPMGAWRKVVWCAMLIILVVCFTALGTFLELRMESQQAILVLATLLIMTPTVFFAVQRVFDFGDRLVAKLKRK